jgi:hypothetical protein
MISGLSAHARKELLNTFQPSSLLADNIPPLLFNRDSGQLCTRCHQRRGTADCFFFYYPQRSMPFRASRSPGSLAAASCDGPTRLMDFKHGSRQQTANMMIKSFYNVGVRLMVSDQEVLGIR